MKEVNDIADAKKAAGPVFTRFTYCGNDQVYKDNPLKPDEFYSPIFQGCYPDPSIVRKGNDFFMVTSSFVMVPGVPVFHSNDLVNWRQIGHVLDKPSQLNVEDAPMREGIWAPQITYNPFNKTFYMITTHKAAGLGNIVVKTQNPFNGWSDPLKLQFNGIDPSLFFDDDGKAYLVHNDTPEKALYEGHCVIKIWEYDTDADQVIAETDKIVVDGGVDISKEPFWIEGPHIYKKNGRYYLMCAEGGTCEWHSEVIFVSDHAKGPYVPAPGNPILTQRHLPVDRSNKVDQTGHADLIQDLDSKYYGVFLAVRPNNKDRVNTGRETFILPVDWSGEFPVFENGLLPIQPKLKMPKGVDNRTGQDGFLPNGNFAFTDTFTSEKLGYRWVGVRGWPEEFIGMSKDGLKINPYPVNIKEVKPTSTLFWRQQHNNFDATVIMDYKPVSRFELAGIVCYQNESFNYVFGITRKDNDDYIVLQRTECKGKGREAQVASTLIAFEKIDMSKPVKLRVRAQGDDYQFSYSVDDGGYFKNLGGIVSGDILSTNVAGGFTGSLIGLYATSANDIIL